MSRGRVAAAGVAVTVLLALTACGVADATLGEDCAPTRGNGRQLTRGEWNLIVEFASDDRQTFSPEGVTYQGQFRTWCEIRDHEVYATAYWLFVEDIDEIIEAALMWCRVDEDTFEVDC